MLEIISASGRLGVSGFGEDCCLNRWVRAELCGMEPFEQELEVDERVRYAVKGKSISE